MLVKAVTKAHGKRTKLQQQQNKGELILRNENIASEFRNKQKTYLLYLNHKSGENLNN